MCKGRHFVTSEGTRNLAPLELHVGGAGAGISLISYGARAGCKATLRISLTLTITQLNTSPLALL